jgi:tellurite resistance protein TerC
MAVLFPFAEAWWLYAAFVAGVLLLLTLDLGVFRREAREMTFRESLAWCAVWVSLALTFCVGLYAYVRWWLPQDPRVAALPGCDAADAAWQLALEFLTGYVVEYSLSVDNIFVFVLVLRYFAVPAAYQYRVLFYGILGALVFRAIFIALGAVLLQFHWVVWLFGAFLVVTGVRMAFSAEDSVEPDRNVVIRLIRRWLRVTPGFRGQRFVVHEGGRLWATPMLVALLCLEATDIVFAIDSVPAIFALTREPFIVFTSNIFAILGLRSMYFMLGGAVDRFHLLRYGLATVLVFVGCKMTWLDWAYGGKFPIVWSLAIIAVVLAGSVIASLLYHPRPAGPRKPRPSRAGGRASKEPVTW